MADLVILTHGYFESKAKVAAFDLDHTLIRPKGHYIHNHGPTDWKWLHPNIPAKLTSLHKQNYAVVIFTNQSQRFKSNLVRAVIKTLSIPIRAYIAYKPENKKPNTHMFDMYQKELYEHSKNFIDTNSSFFIGDALGREGDWSDMDKVFALGSGLKYHSPEDFFDIDPDICIDFLKRIDSVRSDFGGLDRKLKVQYFKALLNKTQSDQIKAAFMSTSPKQYYLERIIGSIEFKKLLDHKTIKPTIKAKKCFLLKRCPQGYKRDELVAIAMLCGIKGKDLEGTKEELCRIIKLKTTSPLAKYSDILYDVNQEGVMLAENYINTKTRKPIIDSVKGWIMSEKYDGVRAIWNGVDFISRSGNVFVAPDWFKKVMPNKPLDGELFIGRDKFQKTVSVVRKIIPIDTEWAQIKYYIFDYPKKNIKVEERINKYRTIVSRACAKFIPSTYLKHCPLISTEQFVLKDKKDLEVRYKKILAQHGEGAMLRRPTSFYSGKRSSDLLKYKPVFDAEAIITGYTRGTGRNKIWLGAFTVYLEKDPKITFKIGGGLSDKIRRDYLTTHPVGTIITFSYAGLTNRGVPRQPQYLRIRK